MSAVAQDVLARFAEELRRQIHLDLESARAIEARCWSTSLREASTALQGLDLDDLEAYSRSAPGVVAALGTDDDSWPLPTLLGRTLLDLDVLAVLAAEEVQGAEPLGVSAFLAAFREERQQAFRSVLVEATVELTRLVRTLQAWDAAVAITSRVTELGGEGLAEELQREHVGLAGLFEELAYGSSVDQLRELLLGAVEKAESEARATVAAAADEGVGGALRRRWSQSVAGAQAQLRNRRKEALFREAAAWTSHHDGLWARVELLGALLVFRPTLRTEVRNGIDALLTAAVAPLRDPLRKAAHVLRTVQEEAVRDEAEVGEEWAQAAQRVQSYQHVTSQAVRSALAALSNEPIAETAGRLADRCIGACQATLGLLPERVMTVELGDTDPADWPRRRRAELTVREWAGRAVDVERLSGGRGALLSVAEAVRGGIEQARKAPEVLAYNLEAARDEMHMAVETGRAKEDPWGLARTGLDRSADYLDRIVEGVELAHARADRAIREAFDDAELELLARLTREDAWSAELSDAWSDALDRLRGLGRGVRGGGERAAVLTGRVASGAFGRARSAIERARRLIGGGSSALASYETLRELSGVDAHAGALPFVYRRLFSPRPVEDPTLFVGRDADVEAILRHWSDWNDGRTNTLVVTGTFGGGMRSLMASVAARSADPTLWRRVTLARRIDSEATLAALVGGVLLPDPGPIATLEDLGGRLASIEGPVAVHVERLEQLLERTVQGFGLIEAALEFFSTTDSRVAWFVTMPSDSWRLLRSVSPTSAGLARHHPVGPLEQDGLAALLKARHHRSGLALQFDESTIPQTVLRDRKDEAAVERAFFSRFWALTDGSAPLALLYWIRSAVHTPEAEAVTISWPEELDFAFLEDLSWDQVFALQAFAEHGTLSVEDHARVFSMASDRSYDILESLGNLYLVEPAGAVRRVGEQLAFTTVERGTPLRIRPVLQSVVRRVLKARHLTS